jgi:HEAT repeat protein
MLEGKALSQWVVQLRSDNRGLQLRAAQALSRAPAEMQPAIVPQLLPLLKSERENDKFVAAQTLGEYGPAARAAIPDLLPMLGGTQYERNRAAAAKALGQILSAEGRSACGGKDAQPGDEAEKVTQALIAVFEDKYSDVRREAVTACGTIGPAAKSCIPHLPRRLVDRTLVPHPWIEQDERSLVERAAAWTAGRMGPLAAEHIDRLIALMHGRSYPEVVEAIGRIGPVHENVARNVTDRMEKVMNTHDLLLGERKAGEYVPACFAALETFGPKAAAAVPLMARLLAEQPREYGGPHIPLLALKVLGAVGRGAAEAVPDIEKLAAATKDPKVREAAEQALARIK